MQKGFVPILVLVGILVMVVVVAGAYYFGKSQVLKTQSQLKTSPTPSSSFVPGTVIVKFKSGITVNSSAAIDKATNSESFNKLLVKIQAKEIKSSFYEENPPLFENNSQKDSNLGRIYVIRFNQDQDVQDVISLLRADSSVEEISPKGYFYLH